MYSSWSGDHEWNFVYCHVVHCKFQISIVVDYLLGYAYPVVTCSVVCLVVFLYKEPRLGLNISSTLMMSSLVTLQVGIILPLTYLIRFSILGLPLVFCRKQAF